MQSLKVQSIKVPLYYNPAQSSLLAEFFIVFRYNSKLMKINSMKLFIIAHLLGNRVQILFCFSNLDSSHVRRAVYQFFLLLFYFRLAFVE